MSLGLGRDPVSDPFSSLALGTFLAIWDQADFTPIVHKSQAGPESWATCHQNIPGGIC